MGVFDDKRYEELDWISQATEPIESHLNVYLEAMPDEFIVGINDYLEIVGDSTSLDMSKDRVVRFLMNRVKKGATKVDNLSWEEQSIINKCFTLEFEGNPTLDFESNTIYGGELKLVKHSSTLDEKVLTNILGNGGLSRIRNISRMDVNRANEILELLGNASEGLRTRSPRLKRSAIYNRLKKLMEGNEWNIRSTELADKVGTWIASYVETGNLAAMSNFCRLKVMTHKGLPIYSMEEVE